MSSDDKLQIREHASQTLGHFSLPFWMQMKIHLINHHLKKLGEELGLSSKLTSYVARHSWASIAKSQDVPVAAISEAMGHTTERTTRIYLKSFENTLVDDANQKVLRAIA